MAGSDGTELLELGEEVFDQMPRLEDISVVVTADPPIGLGRNNRGLARGGEWLDDAFIGVVYLVGKGACPACTAEDGRPQL